MDWKRKWNKCLVLLEFLILGWFFEYIIMLIIVVFLEIRLFDFFIVLRICWCDS